MHDVFISHASEDKDTVARPLAGLLQRLGLRVWLDDLELTLGDNLRRSIERGLSDSDFGAVILSHSFFAKEWPQRELDGLASREDGKHKLILPVWHGINRPDVLRYSPLLADRLAASTAGGLESVAREIHRAIERARTIPPPAEAARPKGSQITERALDWDRDGLVLEAEIRLGDSEVATAVLHRALEKLAALKYGANERAAFETVFGELSRNAFEHGCRSESDVVRMTLELSQYYSSVTVLNPAGVVFGLEEALRRQGAALTKDGMQERGRGLLSVAEIADELKASDGDSGVKALIYPTPVKFEVATDPNVTTITVISGVRNPSFGRRLMATAERHTDTHLFLDFSRAEKAVGSSAVSEGIRIARLFQRHGKRVAVFMPYRVGVALPGTFDAPSRKAALASLQD